MKVAPKWVRNGFAHLALQYLEDVKLQNHPLWKSKVWGETLRKCFVWKKVEMVIECCMILRKLVLQLDGGTTNFLIRFRGFPSKCLSQEIQVLTIFVTFFKSPKWYILVHSSKRMVKFLELAHFDCSCETVTKSSSTVFAKGTIILKIVDGKINPKICNKQKLSQSLYQTKIIQEKLLKKFYCLSKKRFLNFFQRIILRISGTVIK